VPARGTPVDIFFGPPVSFDPVAWPRSREQVEKVSILLRGELLALLEQSLEASGRELPGPLPAGETEPDPSTGVIERGAS
jgi:1-acyl-sn-glycerol-3-phosphate acyltransferase